MTKLHKLFSTLLVLIVVVVTAVFVVDSKSTPTETSQSAKLDDNLVKTVKKHVITPNQARNFLNDLDVPTRDYLDTELQGPYGQYQADSDLHILESKTGERNINNISYSVYGDKQVANAVEVILNVNDLSFSSNSVDELIKYSDYLMDKVTGEHLNPQIKKAIQTKTSGEWVVNGYKIKLKKEIFPDEEPIDDEEPISDHGAFSLSFLIEL